MYPKGPSLSQADTCLKSMVDVGLFDKSVVRIGPGILAFSRTKEQSGQDDAKIVTFKGAVSVKADSTCAPAGVGLKEKMPVYFENALNGKKHPGSTAKSISDLNDKQKSLLINTCHSLISETDKAMAKRLLFIPIKDQSALDERYKRARTGYEEEKEAVQEEIIH